LIFAQSKEKTLAHRALADSHSLDARERSQEIFVGIDPLGSDGTFAYPDFAPRRRWSLIQSLDE
jgi:hypothetical protein